MLVLTCGQVFCVHSILFFKHLGFVVCFFKATATLARGWTNINCQKTACSEKLHRAKPQPHCSLQARSPSGEARKEAFGVLRERAAEKLRVRSPAALWDNVSMCFNSSYLALPAPPVIPSYKVLVILILLGQVVVQDAVCHRLQRHGHVREQNVLVPPSLEVQTSRSSIWALPLPGLLLLLKICSFPTTPSQSPSVELEEGTAHSVW